MVNLVLISLLLIFSVLGICDLIYVIRMFFYYPNMRIQSYSFLILKKGYAIKQLNFIWQKIKWHGDEFSIGIIAVTDKLEDDELQECKRFSDDKNILLLNVSED